MTKEETRKQLKETFAGYNNGHSAYMVVDVDKKKLTDWAVKHNMDGKETIAGLKFEKGNGITVAKFETCERYPRLNGEIMEAFPEATCYGYGMWDIAAFETNASNDSYLTSLDDVFEDDGNLRLDVNVTDNRSGCSFGIGDLFCFYSLKDIAEREDNTNYSYLMGLLGASEQIRVEFKVEECKEIIKEFYGDEDDEDNEDDEDDEDNEDNEDDDCDEDDYEDVEHEDTEDGKVIVEIGGVFKDRLLELLEDELSYHVSYSGCAEEYHGETLAEIELLYRMGYWKKAEKYKDEYLEYIDEKGEPAQRKELNGLWKRLYKPATLSPEDKVIKEFPVPWK